MQNKKGKKEPTVSWLSTGHIWTWGHLTLHPMPDHSFQGSTQSHIQFKPQTACTTLFNASIMQSTDLSGKFSLISTAVLSPTVLCLCHVQKSIWSPRAGEKEDQRQAPLHRSQRRICHNPVFHLLPWSTEQMRKESKWCLYTVCN